MQTSSSPHLARAAYGRGTTAVRWRSDGEQEMVSAVVLLHQALSTRVKMDSPWLRELSLEIGQWCRKPVSPAELEPCGSLRVCRKACRPLLPTDQPSLCKVDTFPPSPALS